MNFDFKNQRLSRIIYINMKGNIMALLIIIGILFTIDVLSYMYLKQLFVATGWQRIPYGSIIFYTITVIGYILLGYIVISMRKASPSDADFGAFFFVFGLLTLLYLPKFNFLIFGLIQYISGFFSAKVSILLFKTGVAFAVISFALILYGILIGKYDFQTKTQPIYSPRLPQTFDGLRIVQVSDIHLGSYGSDYAQMARAVSIINSLKPDIVVFTGDLVINYSSELKGWQDVFNKIEAPYGKFSILGNHDYGDYSHWETPRAKRENLQNIINGHAKLGFKILLNEHIAVHRGTDSIIIAGVENWGLPPFPQHGDLARAFLGANAETFSILLSHDPSHWDAQVKTSPWADLTLSGHTHGFQYGIDKFGIKWSPVQYKYPKWSGLYAENGKYLYVNVGLGVVGFPGRVGMRPEITLFTLHRGVQGE